MSGETEQHPSSWTIDSLYSHLELLAEERDKRYQQKFVDMDQRLQQRFDSQTKAIDAAITAQRAAIDAALTAADKATLKAEASDRDKFASVNEFRQTLSDQATTFITRNEADSLFTRNAEKIQDILNRLDAFVDRDTVMTQYNLVMTQVGKIAETQTLSTGKGAGLHAGWIYMLGLVAALGTLISIYLAFK